MTAVWERLRTDARLRWPWWLGLAVCIGLAGGVVLGAAAGARRTASAYPRMLVATRAEDVYLAGPSPWSNPADARVLDEIERLPQVAAAARIAAVTIYPSDRDAVPTFYHFAGVDPRYLRDVDRPKLLAGRLPDPARADEVLVNPALASAQQLAVGSRVTWDSVTGVDDPKPRRTPVTLTVVGIGVQPNEVVPTALYDDLPVMYLTPAYLRAHPRDVMPYGFEAIRLKRGAADLAAFRAAAERVLAAHHLEGTPFDDRSPRTIKVQHAMVPQATALAIFALLVGVAALLVLGQAVARQLFLDAVDYPTLRALGMTGRQLVAVALLRVGAIAVAGSVLAVALAVLWSPLMPMGLARLAEPRPGFVLDLPVLGLGLVAIPALLLAVAAWPAWRAATVHARWLASSGPGQARPSRLTAGAARAGLPPSAVTGIRMALERGQGRTAVPVRSALVGTVLAIASVTAAATFSASLDRLARTPALYGWTWDVAAGIGWFEFDTKQVMTTLSADRHVAAFAGVAFGEVGIEGRQVAAVGIDQLRGEVFPTLLEGRPPAGQDEIVVGTKLLQRLHRRVGDTVTVAVNNRPLRMRVVGRAVFPAFGAGSLIETGLGEGAAVRAKLFDDPSTPGIYTLLLIRLAPGADERAVARVGDELGYGSSDGCPPSLCMPGPQRPGDLNDFARLRTVPLMLAGMLGLLAVAALGHTLVSSIRRRRRDLAVLKTLGFVRRQVVATVAWQATTLAATAALIGLPLGVAGGRWAWRLFAGQLGVGADPATPALAVLLALPAAVLVANLIAAVPALLAGRTRPALVLRSE